VVGKGIWRKNTLGCIVGLTLALVRVAAAGQLRVGHGSLFQNPTHKSLHPTQPNPSSTLGMAY